jgi:Esterase-like activity of phytase
LRVDVATAQVTGEFVFRLDEVCAFVGEAPGCALAPGETKLSPMTAISDTRLLIDERTDYVAKIVLVDVSQATDIYLSQ